jgi:outer membrane protein OmpA-like peptidoglycan-associated protein
LNSHIPLLRCLGEHNCLNAEHHGQERAIASNDTVEGRAHNRRVEIHLEEKK